EARDLIFRSVPGEIQPRASQPTVTTADILGQLARTRAAEIAAMPEPETAGDRETRDAAVEGVMTDILADPEAGFQPVSLLYQDFLVRCRIQRVAGEAIDLPEFRRRLALARAGFDRGEVDEGAWAQATLVADALPEDIRGVFLLVARAALAKEACPSDAEIARAYGTRSTGRARRILAYMEERGFLVVASDLRGNRIVQLPDLGWQTAPGDADRVAAE
ncbi:MAG TPA: ATP-binding protein, partial [Methylomirabilota bacterium]|nr:ATP-binding protein [Methylomirabilota bacterium]